MRDRERKWGRVWRIYLCACRVAAAWCPLSVRSETSFTTYLHILKPSCNIASAVFCLRCNQFSASLSFMCNLFVWLTSYSDDLSYFISMCHGVYIMPSFVLSITPWWFTLGKAPLKRTHKGKKENPDQTKKVNLENWQRHILFLCFLVTNEACNMYAFVWGFGDVKLLDILYRPINLFVVHQIQTGRVSTWQQEAI